MKPLLDSNVFNYEFDLDEWPSTHNVDEEFLRPYNENLFDLRKNYSIVFPEEEFLPLEQQEENGGGKTDSSKVYKIRYSINMLPQLGVYMSFDTNPYTKKV